MTNKAHDGRRRAIALTAAAVTVLGGALAWWPDVQDWRRWLGIENAKARVRAEHVAREREAEVKLRFQQGVIMLHARQYDPAITAFHRVLELAPTMPEAHANMGFALLGMQRFAAARDFFESATDLRAGQINAYYGLALALEGLNDLAGAVAAMRAYQHRAPENDPFRGKAQATLERWQTRLAGK